MIETEVEEWRAVVGWESRYAVSNLGKVHGHYLNKPLIPSKNSDGYLSVELYDSAGGKKPKRVKISSLVAEAFLGPRPTGNVVCHNDGIRDNDALNNLRYATQKENINDKRQHGTINTANNRGEKHGNAKLSIGDVEWMFAADKDGVERKEIAKRLNIAQGQVSEILNGNRWTAALKDKPWYDPMLKETRSKAA